MCSPVHQLFSVCHSYEFALVCDYLAKISLHLGNSTVTHGVCSRLCCQGLAKCLPPNR